MKNTTVRAFSLTSDSEIIIEEYAKMHKIKSRSKALDCLIKDYALVSQYCDKCRTKRKILKEVERAYRSGATHAGLDEYRKRIYEEITNK